MRGFVLRIKKNEWPSHPLPEPIDAATLLQVGLRIEFYDEFQAFFPGQEWRGGTFALLAAVVVTGSLGSLFSAFAAPKELSVGASGAIMGLCGLMLGNLVCKLHQMKRDKAKEGAILQFVIIFMCLPLSFLGCVDNFCHIAGYVGGILLGLVLYGSHLQSVWFRRVVPGTALLLIVALAVRGWRSLKSLDLRPLASVNTRCE